MINSIELKLFNVGHGLSCMIKELPTNYITLIDLGADESFSPLDELKKQNLHADQIFISHPHGDHISEIEKVLKPAYMPKGFYIQDYDWEDVASREQKHLVDKVRKIKEVKRVIPSGGYHGEAELKYWHYSPDDAKKLFGESKYINNSSIAIIYKWNDFKVAILGDLETDALKNFCEFKEFSEFAKGTDILIAPHHGHNSGFPELWVDKIGKPYITLVSIKENDQHVCKKYQNEEFNKGINLDGTIRYTLTTRQDGSITVRMYYNDNKPAWNFSFS